jgi:ADP-heptose:LPS heptosyltransferase
VEILAIHPGALGDIILSLSALGILRRSCPHDIALAGNINYLRAAASGYADRLLSIDSLPLHRLYGASRLPAADVRFWRSFDRIISWTGAGDVRFEQNLGRAQERTLISPWRPTGEEVRHVSQIFIDSLQPWLGRKERASPQNITLTEEDRSRGIEWLRRRGWSEELDLIALHPGAGSVSKRWPLSSFQRLASELLSRPSRKILVHEGPAELGLGRDLALTLDPSSCFLASHLTLKLLSSILICCRAFVGNDSGIAHMAAALGIPSLVLFGPTKPEHWAPLGDSVSVIHDDAGLNKISVEQVLDEVEQLSNL